MAKQPKQKQNQGLIIQQINVGSVQRNTIDIEKWRNAHKSAENVTNPNRRNLYDIYDDILLDAHLSGIIRKRINSITNTQITFTDIEGREHETITKLIGSPWFLNMLTDIIDSLFWGHTLLEFTFDPENTSYQLIPRRHVLPEKKTVIKNQGDTTGIIYSEPPFSNYVLECGSANGLGLLLKAAPYVIYKRNGVGDWSQFCEVFGMPMRVGKYDGYDDEGRSKLETMFKETGAAAYAVIPKETDIEFVESKGQGGTTVFRDLINFCNAELSKLILGNTLTTDQGEKGARSLGEVHQDVEDAFHVSDKMFVLNVLNSSFRTLLEIHGFNPGESKFSFADQQIIPIDKRIDIDLKIHSVAPIDPDYFYKIYNVPPAPQDQASKDGRTSVSKDSDSDPESKDVRSERLRSEHLPTFLSWIKSFFQGSSRQLATDERIMIPGLTNIITKIASDIYYGDFPNDELSADMMHLVADTLMKALDEVIMEADADRSRNALQPGTPAMQWYNMQRYGIYAFSGAKSYDQLKAMRDLVSDSDGNTRPYSQFMKDVIAVNEKYNRTWLETEYGTVVRGGVMGNRWLDIEAAKDESPYLQYVSAGDEHVREEHKALEGIVEPVGSPFWNQYMPPNGWRCRCSVRQLSERQAQHAGYKPEKSVIERSRNTDDNMKLAGANVKDKYWRKNVGKTEILEADKTAYIKSVPGGNMHQLQAVKHYGLKPISKIYADPTKLPKAKLIAKPEFDQTWNSMANADGNIVTTDVSGLKISFKNTFKEHLKNRHPEVLKEITNMVANPDEVWEGFKESVRDDKMWFRKYIKYYNDKAMVVMCDITGTPRTSYPINTDSIEEFRSGVLIKRK